MHTIDQRNVMSVYVGTTLTSWTGSGEYYISTVN